MSAAGLEIVGKQRLAEFLGWSRPTLDKRINDDPNFPVRKIGDQSGGWEFDLDAVRKYLGKGAKPAREQPKRTRTPSRRPSAYHEGEANARQRKDQIDALLKLDKLKRSRRELVEVAEIEAALEIVFAAFVEELSSAGARIAKLNGLPDEIGDAIQEAMDAARGRIVARVTSELGKE